MGLEPDALEVAVVDGPYARTFARLEAGTLRPTLATELALSPERVVLCLRALSAEIQRCHDTAEQREAKGRSGNSSNRQVRRF